MILYPTETIYGLGVNPFDKGALEKLYTLKGREASKSVSWLVRDISDIEHYAELSTIARLFAEQHLPGPLTLVLPLKPKYQIYGAADGTQAFRISSDRVAKKLINTFMAEHDAPLTCTSANASGLPPQVTPSEILKQLKTQGLDTALITEIIDDGPRQGKASTVVRVIGDDVTVLREGAVQIN